MTSKFLSLKIDSEQIDSLKIKYRTFKFYNDYMDYSDVRCFKSQSEFIRYVIELINNLSVEQWAVLNAMGNRRNGKK